MNKNIIFDFDGVIGDTWDATILSRMAISGLSRQGALDITLAYFSEKPAHAKGATEESSKNHYNFIKFFGKEIVKHEAKRFEKFVEHIKSLDIRYAIVSSGSQMYVSPSIFESGLKPTHILAGEDHHSKEEKIAQVCRDWNVEPQEIIYVTDTQADVYELKDYIGIENILGCAWGFQGYDKLLEVLPATQIMREQDELINFLQK